jgi:hypothetical protein
MGVAVGVAVGSGVWVGWGVAVGETACTELVEVAVAGVVVGGGVNVGRLVVSRSASETTAVGAVLESLSVPAC